MESFDNRFTSQVDFNYNKLITGCLRLFDTFLAHLAKDNVKSTCDVNLLSKLSIIFKEWRVIVLFVP
jgi:hypothetical protein